MKRKHERHTSMYPSAVFQLIIAMGLGTIVSHLLSLTGMTFPIYIGAMIVAACIRNIGEYSGKFTIYMGEINDIGGYQPVAVFGNSDDYIKALAACRSGTAAYRTACRTEPAHLFIHVFCGI